MTKSAKLYVGTVIGAGATALVGAIASGHFSSTAWLFVLAAVAAALIKVRLPMMKSTYSLSALVLLFGIFHFALADTLVAACCAALAQSLWNTKTRTGLLKASFNVANHVVSMAVCFTMAGYLRGLHWYEPAIFAAVAVSHFAINSGLTSGAVALSGGVAFSGICNEWYVWTAPYYLVGAALVGLLVGAGRWTGPNAWLILPPLLYLVHFFRAISRYHLTNTARPEPIVKLPARAAAYVYGVIVAGAGIGTLLVFMWPPSDLAKLAAFALLTVATSFCKIRLPGITGTLSLSFILLIVAVAELSLGDAVILAALAATVQCLWRPKRRPLPSQVAFNAACLVLSTAAAGGGSMLAAQYLPFDSLLAILAPAALILCGANTVMVATVLCLIEDRPLSHTLEGCNFWSLPYYLVGAVAAALMIACMRTTGWYSSVLVLPAMLMIYMSYRLHVARSGA